MGFWDSMSGQQIYENFANAPGPDGLMQAQQHLAMVEAVYTERENQIRTLAASMEEGWTGDAAGAAQRGAGPLAVAHGGAAQEMATARDLLANQADSFYVVKSSVTLVPPAPSEPSTFDNLISFGGAQSDYEAGVAKSNAAAQANVAAMDGWRSSSSYNGSMMPTTYGQIVPNAMNISIAEPKNPPPIGPGTGGGGGDIAKPGGGDPGRGKSGYPETGGKTPGYLGGGSRDAIGMFDPNHYQYLGTDGKTTPVDHKSVSTDPTRPGWPDGPGGKGGQSGGGQGGQGSLGGTGFGAFGGSGSSSGSGSGSGAGGRLGGSGSSSGSGVGVGGEKSMGSGKGSGVASSGAANESMGRGGAGTPGAKGTGGRGGMPGGMGGGHKGEGGEDEEHQRKYVMEDDQAFQLTEDGERLVDPHTGLPITPPVIGQ
jgi:hypothetical protein